MGSKLLRRRRLSPENELEDLLKSNPEANLKAIAAIDHFKASTQEMVQNSAKETVDQLFRTVQLRPGPIQNKPKGIKRP